MDNDLTSGETEAWNNWSHYVICPTSEIRRRETSEVDEDGNVIRRRYMTQEEILERERLNQENTSERLRARALAGLAEGNGSA